MSSTAELAEAYMTSAIENFRTSGELAPLVALHGGKRQAMAMVHCDEERPMPDVLVRVTLALGALLEPSHVVLVSETWSRQFAPEESSVSIERGQLERMHNAGDTQVHTSLMVGAWNLKDLDDSVVVMVDTDDDWRRTESTGLGSGSIANAVASCARILPGMTATRPPDYDVNAAMAMIAPVIAGLALEWDPDEPMPEGGGLYSTELLRTKEDDE